MVAEIILGEIAWLCVVAFGLACVAGPIGAAVNAASFPDWAFQRADTKKTFWIVVPIISIFVCGPVGLGLTIAWFRTYRGRVAIEAASASAE